MEKVKWKVEGMTCANCALTVHKYLEKQGGKSVKVNVISGDVSFELNGADTEEQLARGINGLGYSVKGEHKTSSTRLGFLTSAIQRFWFCFPFTALLMAPMLPAVQFPVLMDAKAQLALCFPVYIIGMRHFGKSGIKSIQNGMPNMDVLVSLGATAAFFYSLYGTFVLKSAEYMFYETAAAIITLVFLGNYLENISLRSTQRALDSLSKSQKVIANMLAYDSEHNENVFPVENTQLKVGDLVLIKTGDQVPADCKILWGEVDVDEAIITGESTPLHKKARGKLIGGSIVLEGTVKAQVVAVGEFTILSGIINLVKQAQGEKPPVQLLADRISAVFVPVVIGLALIALALNWIFIGNFTPSLMRSIAVLVIACPCAMGLATPAAIAVGLGRAARKGILFRHAASLELFKDIKQVVFDKTGTLTTGDFQIREFKVISLADDANEHFKRLVYSLEKYSNHPIAKSISVSWKTKDEIRWQTIEEVKGVGVRGVDNRGDRYEAVSHRLVEGVTTDKQHNIYVLKNGQLLGWIDINDTIRPEAKQVLSYLHAKNIKTVLLSGDSLARCEWLAAELMINTVFAEQNPAQKLLKIHELNSQTPTVMVGDGINDAPALAKATVGISLSEASQIAVQTAQVVLMGNGLKHLPEALGLGKATYNTIRQNLFWAFFYNIIAIPVAAFGLLTPTVAALVMGLSDVVLVFNSVRLYVKKIT